MGQEREREHQGERIEQLQEMRVGIERDAVGVDERRRNQVGRSASASGGAASAR